MWALWQDGMRAIICSLSTAPAGTTMWSLPVWRDLPLLVGPTITLNKQAAEHLFSDALPHFLFFIQAFYDSCNVFQSIPIQLPQFFGQLCKLHWKISIRIKELLRGDTEKLTDAKQAFAIGAELKSTL